MSISARETATTVVSLEADTPAAEELVEHVGGRVPLVGRPPRRRGEDPQPARQALPPPRCRDRADRGARGQRRQGARGLGRRRDHRIDQHGGPGLVERGHLHRRRRRRRRGQIGQRRHHGRRGRGPSPGAHRFGGPAVLQRGRLGRVHDDVGRPGGRRSRRQGRGQGDVGERPAGRAVARRTDRQCLRRRARPRPRGGLAARTVRLGQRLGGYCRRRGPPRRRGDALGFGPLGHPAR